MAPKSLPNAAAAARWLRERGCTALCTDSRELRAGDAFMAWPGRSADARQYVPAALAAGASACLVEQRGAEAFFGLEDARVATLAGLKAQAGAIADAYFERPSSSLRVLAVTGTNGKSSTAWWTAQALTLCGQRCALIGTLGAGVPPLPGAPAELRSTGLTTPEPVALHRVLRGFVDQGFAACAIEASSIGLAEHRLEGCRIEVAQFTNLTRDHLDHHGSMHEYWLAKRALFDWPGLRAAVINVDDEHGALLAGELHGRALDLWTTSMRGDARLVANAVRYVDGGLAFEVIEGGHLVPVRSGLIGNYNAANLLAVIGALRARGIGLADAARVLQHLTPVPGRMQRVSLGTTAYAQPDVVVDYAHTPDALEQALRALRPLAHSRAARLWCVFGCGGNRDASKRAPMGEIAGRLADRSVITSDNPRHEDPAAIVAQIFDGVADRHRNRVDLLVDRREAIAFALAEADARDVVLIAGKGHETHQEVAGVKTAFSDAAEALAALRRRPGAAAPVDTPLEGHP